MDRKTLFKRVLKNRYLILVCLILILGTYFGTCVLKIIPENIAENLFGFVSKSALDFKGVFIYDSRQNKRTAQKAVSFKFHIKHFDRRSSLGSASG